MRKDSHAASSNSESSLSSRGGSLAELEGVMVWELITQKISQAPQYLPLTMSSSSLPVMTEARVPMEPGKASLERDTLVHMTVREPW